MGSKGIIHVKVEESTSYAIVKRDDYQYVECEKLGAPITAFIDDYCLDKGTVNPQSTLQSTKWIVIEEIVWDKLLAEHVKETGKQSFGDLEFFKSIPDRHILGKFNGPKAKVNLANFSTPPTPGNIYLLMPYTHYPENRYKSQNLRLVYLKDPYIRYMYIDPPSQNEADIPFGYDSKLHLYGMYAHVYISTHLLPDFRKVGEYGGDKIITEIKGEVFFVNDANEEVKIDDFSIDIENNKKVYNSYIDLKIFIDPEWKNVEGVHNKPNQSQKYYLRARAITKDVTVSINPTPHYDYTITDHKTIQPAYYNTYKDFQKWFKFNADEEMWLEMPMQAFIEVRWDTMEMIYKKFEIEKNNQIQYIGDVKYWVKEFDPCGYSTITVKDEDDKKREALILFDEDASVIDNTDNYFEITTGEKAKLISITLGNLKHKGVYCQGLLLEAGQKHDNLNNVFQIERATYAAIRDEKGYKTEKDETHQDQLGKANTKVTKENETDYDVIKNPDNSKIKTVQHVMNWKEGINYTFKEENELDLNLRYNYNKTLTISNDEFNPNVVGNLFEEAWLFNYLWLDIDKHKQVYYIPIGSCRYPNQIVKINVLPDIKWTLLFKFNFKEEDFKQFKEEHQYEVNAFFIHRSETTVAHTPSGTTTSRSSMTAGGVTLRRNTTIVPVQRQGGVKRLIEILKNINVSLTAEWKDEEDKKQEKDVIEGFATQICNFFGKISDIAKLAGNLVEGDSNEEDRSNKEQLEKEINKMKGGRSLDGIWNALNQKTQETEILYPSIAIAASWYYANADDPKQPNLMGRKSLQIDAKVEASPIIGLEIKWNFLEMLARKHPLAFVIKKALDLTLYLIDPRNGPKVTFKLSGELGLKANFKHNMLAGNAYSKGYSAKKEELISGAATIKADLQGSIIAYATTYLIISEYTVGGEAKIGVKAEVVNKVYLGADIDGLYLANTTSFDGFTFYVESEAKLEISLFGVKVVDWNPKYDPEPKNWGKCSMDWIKVYLNNPDKKTEFAKFKTDEN